MAGGRPHGAKGSRSLLAIDKLRQLNFDPIVEATRRISELDKMSDEALKAYEKMRGYGDKMDAGTSYLATALKAKVDAITASLKLAQFVHPTLAAVAHKDAAKDSEQGSTERVVSALEVRKQILSDPFAPKIDNVPQLVGGLKDEEK